MLRMNSSPKWLTYAFCTLFCWGIFGFLSKLGSNKLSPVQMQIFFTVGLLIMTIPALFRSGISASSDKLGLLYGTFTGLFSVIANLAVFAALKEGQASVVQPATGLYPLVTVILAVIILKERMNVIQLVGVILALIALWILSL